MLDFTTSQNSDALINLLTEMFCRQTKKKAANALFMGVSPLVLVACGGGSGSDSSTEQSLVSGTDGNDEIPNSAANERFEGGLGDDTYSFHYGGIDSISDTGGTDTVILHLRDDEGIDPRRSFERIDDDLLITQIDGSSLTIEGQFSGSGSVEFVDYYLAGTSLGVERLGSLELASIVDSDLHLLVGSAADQNFEYDGAALISVWTNAGNDIIKTGSGDDWVRTGAGDDTINAGNGDDHVFAGDGDDVVYMSPGADIEDGGDGVDTLILGDWAGDFSGTLNLETGANFAAGGTDNANHKVYNFENVTTMNTGSMTIIGTAGANIIETGSGNDIIEGGAGNDRIYAGDGDDTVYGGAGDDIIEASLGADFEDGGEGNDTLSVYSGNISYDVFYNLSEGTAGVVGSEGGDSFANIENVRIGYLWRTDEYVGASTNWTLIGSDYDNRLESSEGNDNIEGKAGDDTIITKGGNDIIDGGAGDDVIYAGAGEDTLRGGDGADTFVFKDGETGTDIITDFELAEGDKLDLSSYGISTEDGAEAAMSDAPGSVEIAISGSTIVSITGLSVAEFSAADGWIA